jgi:hypothetical protein
MNCSEHLGVEVAAWSGDGLIGVALGSPSHQESMESAAHILQSSPPSSHPPSEPVHFSPPKVKREKTSSSSDEPAPPKTPGWRRMFGKGGLFRKHHPKSREVTPELPELPKQPAPTSTLKKSKKSPQKPQAPSLEVEIPNVELERYSIMFGSLLPPSEKSSLFARRRSKDIYLPPNSDQEDTVRPLTPPK